MILDTEDIKRKGHLKAWYRETQEKKKKMLLSGNCSFVSYNVTSSYSQCYCQETKRKQNEAEP